MIMALMTPLLFVGCKSAPTPPAETGYSESADEPAAESQAQPSAAYSSTGQPLAAGTTWSGTFRVTIAYGDNKGVDVITFQTDGRLTAQVDVGGSDDDCEGAYSVDEKGAALIEYDGLSGPGSGGGCHNYSSLIQLGDLNPASLKKTVTVPGQSQRFFFAKGEAIIEPMN